jgi:hypothetical protein
VAENTEVASVDPFFSLIGVKPGSMAVEVEPLVETY